MELNKNSKYNKWYLLFNNNLPNNFCSYFWGSVKSLLLTIIYLSFILFIISSIFTPILLFWNDFEKGTELLKFNQATGISIYIIGSGALIIWSFCKYIKPSSDNWKPKKDSFMKTWYKDFKNKHCTMITWKD